jgi:hypothetical protein
MPESSGLAKQEDSGEPHFPVRCERKSLGHSDGSGMRTDGSTDLLRPVGDQVVRLRRERTTHLVILYLLLRKSNVT